MSKTTRRRPLRLLLVVAAAIGIALAYRNAVADTGGTYDPAST